MLVNVFRVPYHQKRDDCQNVALGQISYRNLTPNGRVIYQYFGSDNGHHDSTYFDPDQGNTISSLKASSWY